MTPKQRLIERLYRLLLRFYPRKFRYEFSDEMVLVFTSSINEAAQYGVVALACTCLREMRDLPGSIMRQYLDRIHDRAISLYKQTIKFLSWMIFDQRRDPLMIEKNASNNWNISNRDAWKAALPPILFGLGITLAPLVAGGKWNEIQRWRLYTSVVVMAMPMAVIAVGGFIALVKRIPDWGYTWVGVSMMGALMLIKTYAEELDDVGRYMISQVGDLILGGTALLGVLVVLAWIAMRGWQQAGLLSMGMASVLGLTLLQTVSNPPMNRQDLSMLSLPLGMMAGSLIYLYATRKAGIKALSLTGVGVMNILLIYVAHTAWLPWMLSRDKVSPIWPLVILFSGALISGPVLGWMSTPLRRKLRNA